MQIDTFKSQLRSLFLTLLPLIIVSITFLSIGIYFEEDEVFANYFFSLNGKFLSSHLYMNEEYFLVSELIIRIQHLIKGINIFALYKILSMVIILSYLFHIFSRRIQSKLQLTLIILSIGGLFLSSIVLINNVRLSYWFALLALLYLYDKQNELNYYHLYHFYFIAFLAITSRFQITLIVFSLSFVFGLFFMQKRTWLHLGIVLLTCVILFSIFTNSISNYNPKTQDFYNYELSIYDRNDFILQDMYNEYNTLDYVSTLKEKELKYLAKSLFLVDSSLNNISFQEILLHPTLFEYLFQNDNFLSIYSKKLHVLAKTTYANYRWLIPLLGLLLLVLLLKCKSRVSLFKIVLFLLAYLSIPFLISLVGTVPNKFLAPYLAAPILLILLKLHHEKARKNLLLTILPFAFVGIQTSFITIPNLLKVKAEEKEKLCIQQQLYQEDVIYLNYFDTQAFSSRAFELFDRTEFVFMDLGGFIDYPSILMQNKRYFGENNAYMQGRYNDVLDLGAPVYGSLFQMLVVKHYLKKVHNFDLYFKGEMLCEKLEFYKFRLSRTPFNE